MDWRITERPGSRPKYLLITRHLLLVAQLFGEARGHHQETAD